MWSLCICEEILLGLVVCLCNLMHGVQEQRNFESSSGSVWTYSLCLVGYEQQL
jgi:hypothetical protein